MGFLRRKMCIPGAIVVARGPFPGERLIIKRVSSVNAKGYFEVLGDNSAASTDSRRFGPLAPNLYEGRAILAYWPKLRWLGLGA